MELYRKDLKLAVIKGLDESRGSSNVPIKLTHDTSDEYINYTEQIHIRYLFDNQVKEEILPTNDNGFYIPGKPLSHDGPIELAVHLINGNIELVTNELSFVVKNAPNGTTQVDPSEFTWQQLVDQYVNAKLHTFANKLDLSKFEETVNGSIENQSQNIESFKTEVNANLSNQDKKITDLQNTTKVSLDSQNTKIDNFKSEVNTSLSNQNTSINQTTSAQNSKITTLESRMDTFTRLSEGSTTGDAELQDIRVGANGITYDTAGNAVRGQYSQLKEDLGEYIQTLVATTRYPYFTVSMGEKLYVKTIDIDSSLFSTITVYGNKNDELTNLFSTSRKEFIVTNIQGNFDKIDIYFNLKSVPSSPTTIKAITHINDYGSLSDKVITLDKDIFDLNSVISNDNSGDLIQDVNFYISKKLPDSGINYMSIFNYESFMLPSQYGGMVSKKPIKIRTDSGELIKKLFFILPPDYTKITTLYCFGKDGEYLRILEGENVSSYENDDIYYILPIAYSSSVNRLHIIYDENKKYTFEVGSGKEYTQFNDCIKSISSVPYEKIVKVYGGTYDIYNEYGGDTFANSIASGTNWRTVSVVVPNNTKIIGIGYVTLRMTPTSINSIAGGLLSPLNISGNVEVENIHIIASNCRYGIHIEGSGLSEFNNAKYILKNVSVVIEEATQGIKRNYVPCMGIGLNGNCSLILDGCKLTSNVNDRCIFLHDNTFDLDVSPNVIIKNSIFNTSNPTEGSLNLNMYNNENTVIDIDIHDSYVPSIKKWTSDNIANDIYNILMIGCNDSIIVVDNKVSNIRPVKKYNVI